MASEKGSPSMRPRFEGKAGTIRLRETLLAQPLVLGDGNLARKLAKSVELVEVRAGRELTRQGQNDNDIYFLLSGAVSICVNSREIAVRKAGEHVGEMALLDCTALRSASVVATESCVAARLTGERFTRLAKTCPEVWHRIAVTLAKRLRERSRFHTLPRRQPAVFIGSSTEGSKVAEHIYMYLSRFPLVPRLWRNNLFEASRTTIEELVRLTSESDFAVIILTPDDTTRSRGTNKVSPRDNVIFEVGLFMGSVGRERTYLVVPKGVEVKIPTDLLGITLLMYQYRGRGGLAHRLKSVKKELRRLIERHGPR